MAGVVFCAVALLFATNGLRGQVLGRRAAAERKRAGESHWSKLPDVAGGTHARVFGGASLAPGPCVAHVATSGLPAGDA